MTHPLKITIWRVDYANPLDRWQACVDDYDLDKKTGSGSTPREAVESLLEHNLTELGDPKHASTKRPHDNSSD